MGSGVYLSTTLHQMFLGALLLRFLEPSGKHGLYANLRKYTSLLNGSNGETTRDATD